ncbi:MULTISPECIES: hypothetical protein [unclassified Psychrobacter]|uniref:hypothetical protein n=1 Tax=unclassified Psychrobacter TaxID=196806 RepID=UPI0018F4ABDD|nr:MULTISPECIES: hypothetical protein [unclassified Psychrobacter]
MSTQAKALPDNLDALAQREDFKKVNADETIKTLKAKLDDAGALYTSTDDKAELVWRWMDYQGVDFSTEEANTDTEAKDASEANDTDIEPVSEEDSQQSDIVAGDTETQEAAIESESKEAPKQTDDQPRATAAGDTSTKDESAATGINTWPFFSRRPFLPRLAGEFSTSKRVTAQISVTNTGAYAVFEPASNTMIESGETVTIKPTATASMKQITDNIHQISSLRGDVLKIEE